MTLSIALEPDPQRKRQLQERLTAQLPEWFGQPAANRAYAAQAEVLPGYVACLGGTARGLLLLKTHSDVSAEIVWLGVDPVCHRAGIGRALVDAVSDSARFLFVQTLHPEAAYEPYRRTRLFYESLGFRYVLEAPSADPDNPLALYLKVS